MYVREREAEEAQRRQDVKEEAAHKLAAAILLRVVAVAKQEKVSAVLSARIMPNCRRHMETQQWQIPDFDTFGHCSCPD